jgi:hypothetical protein
VLIIIISIIVIIVVAQVEAVAMATEVPNYKKCRNFRPHVTPRAAQKDYCAT